MSPATNYPRDFVNTSPYHIHETSPIPLGSESAPACPGICQQGRCQRPEECLDFADSSEFGKFAGTVAERNAEQTKLPALVTGVAILATIAAVLWAVLS